MSRNSHVQRAELAEGLAYWFLRLNGFLTIENFILHKQPGDEQTGMRTDADMVGVRFNHRSEQGMRDHHSFSALEKPMMVLAEITAAAPCKLNGPWTSPERHNVNRLLSAMGIVPAPQVRLVAHDLYTTGKSEKCGFIFQLASFGMTKNKGLLGYEVLQFTWDEVLGFIHDRFLHYRLEKENHPSWRDDGQELWVTSEKNRENFIAAYLKRLAPPVTS